MKNHVETPVYWAAQFAKTCEGFLFALGNLESATLRERLDATPIEKPVFITGLARAGTTTLLELLASLPGVATHRYRDFPFLAIPHLWNSALKFLPKPKLEAKERPHADGIFITPESAEAMEEMLWMHFFKHAHNPNVSSVMGADQTHSAFEMFYKDHIKKLLRVRNAARYVSKGNYNITRIAYLHKLFPDAKFIIPIRAPEAHVVSLMRQHEHFCRAHAEDNRAGKFLALAGHFEFGPNARFINTGRAISVENLSSVKPWAAYWNAIYAHVHETLAGNPALRAATHVVRYEDVCANPHSELHAILAFTGFDASAAEAFAPRIRAPNYYTNPLSPEETEIIRQETLEAREFFGYA